MFQLLELDPNVITEILLELKRIADSLEHLCNNTGEEIDRKIDDHVYEAHEDE